MDYLAAYTATGKPPLPCPPEPVDPKQRASLNLPPLFEPHVEYEHIPTLPNVTTLSSNVITSSSTASGQLQDLPALQLFRPLNDNGEKPQSISLQPEFSHYSLEVCTARSLYVTGCLSYVCYQELRHDAYIRGNKKVDLPAGHTYYYPPPVPVSQPPSSASHPPPILSVPSQFPVPAEIFISMSAQPLYSQHSVEVSTKLIMDLRGFLNLFLPGTAFCIFESRTRGHIGGDLRKLISCLDVQTKHF